MDKSYPFLFNSTNQIEPTLTHRRSSGIFNEDHQPYRPKIGMFSSVFSDHNQEKKS